MATDLDRPLATMATVAAEERRIADAHDHQEVGTR
jgi:hypothetical protein